MKQRGKPTVTAHGAPRRRMAYIQWDVVWFLKGIFKTLLLLPHCHTAFSTISSTLTWVDQSPVKERAL
jgi:hypothetical protein